MRCSCSRVFCIAVPAFLSRSTENSLMKYSVLIKAILNVRVDDIEADSQIQAIQRAQEINLHTLIDKDGPVQSTGRPIRYLEYSDENAEYLVDEGNDPEFEKSRWYGRDGKTVVSGDLCSECLRLKLRRT